MKLKASILVPSYNAEKFIKATVESIVQQDFDKNSYEAIFVDDGSRDKTVEILESYKNKLPNFKIVTQKNQGPAKALTKAMQEASGEFLFFMSHDCVAKSYWLKEVVEAFDKDSKVAIVQGQLLPTRPIDLPTFHCNNFKSFQVTFDTAEVAYRAKAVEEVGRYFRDDFSTNGHDADLAWRMIEKGYKSVWLDKVLMYHDVLPRGFWKDVKSYYLMAEFPKLLKLHPGMREFMKFNIVWGSLFKYFFVVGIFVSLLLLFTNNLWFGLSLLLFTLGFSIFRVLRLSRSYNLGFGQKLFVVFPHRMICESLLGFYLLYGSIKYRSLVL